MNLRVVKKDVDFMVSEVISDAFIAFHFTEKKEKQEEIVKVMNDACQLKDDTFDKINHPNKEMKARAYYRETIKEFLGGIDNLFERLSAVVK